MKPIRQEDLMGCGVACTAFVLSISYKEALGLFPNGKRKAKTVGFLCEDIVYTLRKHNPKYQYKYIKIKKEIYKPGTIVFLRRSKKYLAGHYIARSNHKWMDPWINFPDTNIKAGFRKRLPGKPIYVIQRS